MLIQRLVIQDFRNLQQVELAPIPGFNLICGPNGAGKTSVLEAIYYLALGRSFRMASNQYLVQQGKSTFSLFAQIKEELDAQAVLTTIGMSRTRGEDLQIKINSDPLMRLMDIIDHICVQVIHPQGIELITKEAEGRRSFIDWGVYYSDPEFKQLWLDYRKALKQRNTLLRQTPIRTKRRLRYVNQMDSSPSRPLMNLGSVLTTGFERPAYNRAPSLPENLQAADVSLESFSPENSHKMGNLPGAQHLQMAQSTQSLSQVAWSNLAMAAPLPDRIAQTALSAQSSVMAGTLQPALTPSFDVESMLPNFQDNVEPTLQEHLLNPELSSLMPPDSLAGTQNSGAWPAPTFNALDFPLPESQLQPHFPSTEQSPLNNQPHKMTPACGEDAAYALTKIGVNSPFASLYAPAQHQPRSRAPAQPQSSMMADFPTDPDAVSLGLGYAAKAKEPELIYHEMPSVLIGALKSSQVARAKWQQPWNESMREPSETLPSEWSLPHPFSPEEQMHQLSPVLQRFMDNSGQGTVTVSQKSLSLAPSPTPFMGPDFMVSDSFESTLASRAYKDSDLSSGVPFSASTQTQSLGATTTTAIPTIPTLEQSAAAVPQAAARCEVVVAAAVDAGSLRANGSNEERRGQEVGILNQTPASVQVKVESQTEKKVQTESKVTQSESAGATWVTDANGQEASERGGAGAGTAVPSQAAFTPGAQAEALVRMATADNGARKAPVQSQEKAEPLWSSPLSEFSIWNEQIATLSEKITEKRLAYIKNLQVILQEMIELFLPNFKLKFELHFGWDKGLDLREQLAYNLEKERGLGYTLYGCHRADLKIKNHNLAAGATLSRGQLKMLVYAMRLAQGRLLKLQNHRSCIYLIDDLNSELDANSQRRLLNTLLECQHQVFISNIQSDFRNILIPHGRSDIKVFSLDQGHLVDTL